MILVTGATGHVGRAVACRLASLGHDVVAKGGDVQADLQADLGVGASRRSLALCLLHLVRLNRRRSLQLGPQ